MKINERCILLLSIIFPLYLFLALIILFQFIGYLFLNKINEDNLIKAVYYDRENSQYYYLIGRLYQYDIFKKDFNKAEKYYIESLKRNPLQGGCWIDLANIYKTQGRIVEAGEALKKAVSLNSSNPEIIWEAGIFFLNNNNIRDALNNFKRFIILKPESQKIVYDMLYKLSVTSDDIIKNLLPESISYFKNYLLYLISTGRINDAKNVWENIKGQQMDDELTLKYIDFLISKYEYAEAKCIWSKFVGKKFKKEIKDSNIEIWNGSFEYEIQGKGFDWKISETKGVDVFIDKDIYLEGKQSLGVDFDGTENMGIVIASQVVLVNPGTTYKLKANIKTNNLTTTNGVYFHISGHDCKELSASSEVFKGTNFWKELSVDFKVPSKCNAINVMIKRDKSQKLDNKISGSVWIDQIYLTQK